MLSIFPEVLHVKSSRVKTPKHLYFETIFVTLTKHCHYYSLVTAHLMTT